MPFPLNQVSARVACPAYRLQRLSRATEAIAAVMNACDVAEYGSEDTAVEEAL